MTDSHNQAPEKSENRQLRLNHIALGLALAVLVGIIACIAVAMITGEGLLFGMLLAGFFPYAVALGILGLVGYVVLFLSNRRAEKKSLQTSKRPTRTWWVFLGLTACVVVILAVCLIISVPVIVLYIQTLWTELEMLF